MGQCTQGTVAFLLCLCVAFCSLSNAQRSQPGTPAAGTRRQPLQQGTRSVCSGDYPGIPFNYMPPQKVLALTFDDGPWPKNMHGVLDVLKAEQVPATFFINTVTGLKEGPPDFNTKAVQDVVRRLLSEGHELGSHAALHLPLTQQSPHYVDQLLSWALGNISAVNGGKPVPLFRSPYGDGYDKLPKDPPAAARRVWGVVRKRHLHIGWTFDGKDWGLKGSEPGCEGRMFEAYGPPLVKANTTGVVIMHSTPYGIGGCPKALQRLIRYYRAAGYKFVKVSWLVQQLYGMAPLQALQQAQRCAGAAGPRTSLAQPPSARQRQ